MCLFKVLRRCSRSTIKLRFSTRCDFWPPPSPRCAPPQGGLAPPSKGWALAAHLATVSWGYGGSRVMRWLYFFLQYFCIFLQLMCTFSNPPTPPFFSNFSYPRRFRARSLLRTHVRPFGLYKRTRKHPSARSGLRWPENCIQPSPKLLKLQLLSRKRSSWATASSASWGGL